MLTPPEPVLTAELFPEILEQLLQLLRDLEPGDWDRPTVCAGWSVKDVALHLLGGEIGNVSVRRDGHSISPAVEGWDSLVSFINHWNEDWVHVSRRISNRLLIDLLAFTGRQMSDYVQTLDMTALGGPVGWAGPDPQPVWLDVAREYTERWHHQQHIRDAANRPGLKGPRYLQPVLATFVWALPRAFLDVGAPSGAAVSLTITGDSGGVWSIVRQEGEWRLYQGAADRPEAQLFLDQDDAWRLFTRGLPREHARARSTIMGDGHLAEPILDMVSIIA